MSYDCINSEFLQIMNPEMPCFYQIGEKRLRGIGKYDKRNLETQGVALYL